MIIRLFIFKPKKHLEYINLPIEMTSLSQTIEKLIDVVYKVGDNYILSALRMVFASILFYKLKQQSKKNTNDFKTAFE